jgi:hypothetical protein
MQVTRNCCWHDCRGAPCCGAVSQRTPFGSLATSLQPFRHCWPLAARGGKVGFRGRGWRQPAQYLVLAIPAAALLAVALVVPVVAVTAAAPAHKTCNSVGLSRAAPISTRPADMALRGQGSRSTSVAPVLCAQRVYAALPSYWLPPKTCS